MKNLFIKFLFIFFFVFSSDLFLFATQPDGGGTCQPSHRSLVKKVIPPKENPYPPITPEDQKRVKFADQAIQTSWKPRQSASFQTPKILYLHVVPWSLKHFQERNLPFRPKEIVKRDNPTLRI